MDVRVAGHQVDTGESLREQAMRGWRNRPKNISRGRSAPTSPSAAGRNNDFTCDIVAPVVPGRGAEGVVTARRGAHRFQWRGRPIETQLRRYVKRLREHKAMKLTLMSRMRVIRSSLAADAGTTKRRAFPAIIAETRVDIPEASVSDAVMLMDLRNTNALMFKNQRVGRAQHDLPPRRRKHRLG